MAATDLYSITYTRDGKRVEDVYTDKSQAVAIYMHRVGLPLSQSHKVCTALADEHTLHHTSYTPYKPHVPVTVAYITSVDNGIVIPTCSVAV